MFDVMIIGGGPAGLTAALYARRYGLETLVLEELYLGGQIVNAPAVENLPGYAQPISGGDWIDSLEKQVRVYTPTIVYESVKAAELNGKVKRLHTASHDYEGKTVIIASGRNPRPLGLNREDEFKGKGISYCATCDGNFFRGQDVAVVGGGDTAVIDAHYLSRICRKVSIIHRRDTFRAAQTEIDKLAGAPNVELLLNSEATELIGVDTLEALRVRVDGAEQTLPVRCVFVAVGATPNTMLFQNELPLDENGYIITNQDLYTGVPGVFAAGDVRHKKLMQAVTAAADGAATAYEAMLALKG